jgi:hypothetical protein
VQIGSVEIFGKVADIDSFVFISQWYDGVSFVNIDDPQLPHIEGAFETPRFGDQFFLGDGYAYGPADQFDVIDLSDPASPFRIGSTDEGGGWHIDVVDTIAYVSSNDSVFRIFNIADPGVPFLAGSTGEAGYSYAVAANGDYAFLPTWHDGLVVVNTTNPAAPFVEINHMDWGRSGYALLSGDVLYMEDIIAINVSDPLDPFLAGELQFYGNTHDAAIVDTFIYLASGDSELMNGWLRIASINDPENPYSLGTYSTSNEGMSVAAEGNIACMSDGAGLYLLNVSDPANPTLLANGGVLAMSHVEMNGEYIYVSGSFGFYVFQYTTVCGDANDDGTVNVGDAVYIIQYVFAGGPPPPWICKADANDDGLPDVGDAVYLVNYIFRSGSPPIETCCD